MTISSLKPELILSHNGVPFNKMTEQFTEETFKQYCDQLIEFVTNSRVKTAFFLLGDYYGKEGSNKKKSMYNYLDPNAPGADGTPWIVTHFLNRLPQDVEAGAFIDGAKTKYVWNLYDQNNFKGNNKIGNGEPGFPMDNLAQAFKLIKEINTSSAKAGGAQFTHMQFDGEGAGDIPNDVPYGGKNGDPLGIGYAKWIWNQNMPKSVTFADEQASNNDFQGHYQWGWIKYQVAAWAKQSGGTIDSYSENYWIGENQYEPGKFPSGGIHAVSPYANDKNVPGKWLNLPTISKVLKGGPDAHLPISGGSNNYNWWVLDNDGKEVLSPQAVDTVYSFYKDHPEAIVEMFDNQTYVNTGKNRPATLSSGYYGPVSTLDPTNRFGDDSPQASIPTYSIEYLSSTNGDNAKNPKSLMGQYTNNSVVNSNGGSFDGLSVLDYNDWITFLNGVADKISEGSKTTPEKARVQIYEQQFLPLDWISQSVANPWTDERLGGSDEDEIINGHNGNDIYTGGKGADTFHSHYGTVTVTDFNPYQGDKVVPLPGTYRVEMNGNDLHMIHNSGALTVLKNTSLSTYWNNQDLFT